MKHTKQTVYPMTRAVMTKGEEVEVLYYSTSVNLYELHRLACKAARNKSGKAKSGPVEVVITERGAVKDGREVTQTVPVKTKAVNHA